MSAVRAASRMDGRLHEKRTAEPARDWSGGKAVSGRSNAGENETAQSPLRI